MADKRGHITKELRFGGNLRLLPPTSNYGKVRDAEWGKVKREIEDFESSRELKDELKEVWDE